MIRRVLLARHGETEWNRIGRFQGKTDVPLNDVGREQARALGERLRAFAIGAAIASDLSRARETAEIAAGSVGVHGVAVDPGLRERDYGEFEGLTREECEARYPAVWAEWKKGLLPDPPGAETRAETKLRLAAALARVVQGAGREHDAVLVVSHGGAMRSLIEHLSGALPPPVANGALFVIEHDGAVVLRVDAGA